MNLDDGPAGSALTTGPLTISLRIREQRIRTVAPQTGSAGRGKALRGGIPVCGTIDGWKIGS